MLPLDQPLAQVDPVEDLTFGHTARARLSQTDHSVLGAEDAIHSRGIHAVPRSTQCCFGESNSSVGHRRRAATHSEQRQPGPGRSGIVATLHLLWLESIAIVAFGLSWLVNGEVFLADPPDTAATS